MTALVVTIGLFGFAAGPDVYVVDYFSIADPIGARLEISELIRPGHEKEQPRSWADAAAGIDSPDGRLAAKARSCGRLASLLRGISVPFDREVAWSNLKAATADSLLAIPRDPRLAVERFCSGTPDKTALPVASPVPEFGSQKLPAFASPSSAPGSFTPR